MLEKIICIDNVGVIKKGAPKSVDLQKVALIYADNARGKSTLSSLLLACSGANVQDVVNRKTVGATTAQKVIFRFNPPGGAFNSEFDGVAWKGAKPNLHVFNQAFVERNVFASNGVLPEQREALLTLALGDAAIAFAFFLAKLFADPNRAGSTVVLDDVFTSLDKHRRHNTIETVLRMVPSNRSERS